MKLLVVEDDLALSDVVDFTLRRAGFEVVRAYDGLTAVTLWAQEAPDLVLLDLMMPDMDGWEVYQQMKADQSLRDIPVIVVTAKAQNIDKVLGLHIAKVDDYIAKPFSPQELLDSVEQVLSRK